MADDKTKVAASGGTTKSASAGSSPLPGVAAPPSDGEPGQMIPKAKYDEILERMNATEKTLQALQAAGQTPRGAPQAAQQMQAAAYDAAESIAKRLSSDKETAQQWLNFLVPFFEEMSRPYINTMAAVADKLQGFEIQGKLSDYKDYATEIDQERTTRMQRGEYLPHEEAYHMVRSRKLPEIMEKERQKAVEESRAREAEAQSISASDSGSDMRSGPAPLKTNNAPLSQADFMALSLEDKERYLENVTF